MVILIAPCVRPELATRFVEGRRANKGPEKRARPREMEEIVRAGQRGIARKSFYSSSSATVITERDDDDVAWVRLNPDLDRAEVLRALARAKR